MKRPAETKKIPRYPSVYVTSKDLVANNGARLTQWSV